MGRIRYLLALGALSAAAIFVGCGIEETSPTSTTVPGAPAITPTPISTPGLMLQEILANEMEAPAEVHAGELPTLSLAIENTGNSELSLWTAHAPHDFVVTTDGGTEVWRWSHERSFPDILENLTLKPGEKEVYWGEWDLTDNLGDPVPPGDYLVHGVFEASVTADTQWQATQTARQELTVKDNNLGSNLPGGGMFTPTPVTTTPQPTNRPYLISSDLQPEPGARDVALESTISVIVSRTAPTVELELEPEARVASRTEESEGVPGVKYTFHLAEPLDPSTYYAVKITMGDEDPSSSGNPTRTVTWDFITGPGPDGEPIRDFTVAEGVTDDGPWQLVAFQTANETCIEFRVSDPGSFVCGLTVPEDIGMIAAIATTNRGNPTTVKYGLTSKEVTAVRVDFGDAQGSVEVQPVDIGFEMNFYAIQIEPPPGVLVGHLVVVSAEGEEPAEMPIPLYTPSPPGP
ncbi:MAG: BsuPI-related putative proteinase inhibitor [Dehalococcoidia bacterium]